ncbi:MAG: 3-phosphoshikimate 1-carboxyvinyltransferase [Candidatus Melainabacteria bacterium]|nr:3-phosphoshikimate 1-carboxyvinyltransferase [Candidatus Melainabacteria bacterium]
MHKALQGTIAVPGDKSITHRALIFACLTSGTTRIEGLSPAHDCLSTVGCLRSMGVDIDLPADVETPTAIVTSKGLGGIGKPSKILDAGNSGTTIRLLSGFVAGRPHIYEFDGDASLRKRPMKRVLTRVAEMGASISWLQTEGLAPFRIKGGELTGKRFDLDVASAQVETALLLAGLQAGAKTTVKLPHAARDHTRRMFHYLGVPFDAEDELTTSVSKLDIEIPSKDMVVPADISSAAFFMVAAAIIPGSSITLKNVGINSGRTLILDVLSRMNADIKVIGVNSHSGEPVADIRVRYNGELSSATVTAQEIARGIDEIPILALAGAFCKGELSVSGAEELRHKESDRLQLIADNMRAIGAELDLREDGFTIRGSKQLKGGSHWATADDHRLAMTGMVANLVCENELKLEETNSPRISYPNFADDLQSLL